MYIYIYIIYVIYDNVYILFYIMYIIYMYTYVRTLVIVFYTKYLESFFINRDEH